MASVLALALSLDTVADWLMQKALQYLYKRAWIGAVQYSLALALICAEDEENEKQKCPTKQERNATKSNIISRMKAAMAKEGTRLLEIIDEKLVGWGTRRRTIGERTTKSTKDTATEPQG